MPAALLATMPPIMQALMDAGSGPIFRPSGARKALASAPMTPGSRTMRSPFSSIRQARHPPASTTSTESEMAWPERLVPAARKVRWTPSREASATRRDTSSREKAFTTIFGTSR